MSVDHQDGDRVAIVATASEIVGIDVIDVPAVALPAASALCDAALSRLAAEDPDFVAGAAHASLPALRQPLVWLPGAVPLSRRFVAMYIRWRADGHRRGLAGSVAGLELIDALRRLGAEVDPILTHPEASLYRPALLDASGDEADTTWPGPILASDGRRVPFINIFTTTPERQARLLEATSAIMPVAVRHPGYLRTALHVSLDGQRLANYGQYRSLSQIRAMYFHLETFLRFAAILFKDVTRPTRLFGREWQLMGRPIGTFPRLRCYAVTRASGA